MYAEDEFCQISLIFLPILGSNRFYYGLDEFN